MAEPIIAAGLTGELDAQSVPSVESSDTGKRYNYALVVQVPIPFALLDLNFDLMGDFILPQLAKLGIPKAVSSFMAKAEDTIQAVIDDATDLIKAIPEASVTILVKVGPAIVINIQLVAEKVGVVVPVPHFALSLPNLAVDLAFNLAIPFPVPPPVILRVPIPVPIVDLSNIFTVSGGQVTATAVATATVEPVPIASPIVMPLI